jgi:hypothetical protein
MGAQRVKKVYNKPELKRLRLHFLQREFNAKLNWFLNLEEPTRIQAEVVARLAALLPLGSPFLGGAVQK